MDITTAITQLKNAWRTFSKRGLDFGKSCWLLRETLKASGKRMKGDGVAPILEELEIPSSTFYFWIERYEVSEGLRVTPARLRRRA